MMRRGRIKTAEARPSHERGEEHCERNGGRADDQFEELEPDDFVNERCDAAAEGRSRGRMALDLQAAIT